MFCCIKMMNTRIMVVMMTVDGDGIDVMMVTLLDLLMNQNILVLSKNVNENKLLYIHNIYIYDAFF